MILRSVNHALGWTAAELKLPVFGVDSRIGSITAFTSDSPSQGEITGFPANNLLNAMTHIQWKSSSTADDVFLDCFMEAVPSNYVAFVGHNFSGLSITVYGSTNDSPNDAFEIFEATTITSNETLIIQYPDANYTSIRVRIRGVTGQRIASVIYISRLVRMPRSVKVDVEQIPISRGKKSELISGWSESGNFLGRLVRNEPFESKMEFSNILRSDWVSPSPLNDWIRNLAPNRPFFAAWKPDEYTDEVAYCWLTEPAMPVQNMMTTRYSLTLNLRGIP